MRRDEALAILAAHREELAVMGIRSLALFGPVLHEEVGPDGEIDLLAEFSQPMGFAFFTVRRRLQDLLGHAVNLATHEALEPDQREIILREAVHAAESLAGPSTGYACCHRTYPTSDPGNGFR